jgi:hypothetical protein
VQKIIIVDQIAESALFDSGYFIRLKDLIGIEVIFFKDYTAENLSKTQFTRTPARPWSSKRTVNRLAINTWGWASRRQGTRSNIRFKTQRRKIPAFIAPCMNLRSYDNIV